MGSDRIARRRIAVITTSRADYGCLTQLLREIHAEPDLELQLVVTGSHLSAELGHSIGEIEVDGLPIARRVPVPLGVGDELDVARAAGLAVAELASVWHELAPAILVGLGDRYELLAAATAALLQRLPIAHIHGGETTEGAVDEAIRHSVSKMASVHFPATAEHARRLACMGEDPARIYVCGAPALDAIHRLQLLEREALARRLGLPLERPTAIVTFHPVTLELDRTSEHLAQLLGAIDATGINAVFTMANADAKGNRINEAVAAFCERQPGRFVLHASLGHRVYLSCLRHLQLMIGNSSSGLIEAPSFEMPVVNVGDRQRGRTRAANVIDVPACEAAIVAGVQHALSSTFRDSLRDLRNPYDPYADGGSSRRIMQVLKELPLGPEILLKRFHDAAMEAPRA